MGENPDVSAFASKGRHEWLAGFRALPSMIEFLMRPGRHAELGLSHDEAAVLGQQYVQAWRKEYGNAAANRISQRIFETFRSSG
jgi:hypothetical protein